MHLREQLALLEKLQEIDTQIDHHERDLERLPLEVQEIARNLVVVRREMSEKNDTLQSMEDTLRKKEQDLAAEQEKIKRSERRLLGIKNQKEYNALSKEVKLGKRVAGEIEEIILGLMTEIESLRKFLEQKTADYSEFEKSLLEKKAEAESIGKGAKNALSKLNSEKEKISAAIESDFLKRYHHVKRVRGSAIAEMFNGICSACHMAVPPQLNIQVLKQEEMIVCPNCHRMLYVKPENIPEYNKLDS
jgi:uncharacterized protein